MEILPAGKPCSHRSHSSSSRGSLKGAVGAKIKNSRSEEQRAPEQQARVSPERPPRPFLKTSFGQRLTAQCGSVFFDTNTHCQQTGCSRATPVSGTANRNPHDGDGGQPLEGGGSLLGTGAGGDRTKLRLSGNSHSASGRGSSGLSEVDVKGLVVVAANARSNSEQPQQQQQKPPPPPPPQQTVKLWGFPPGAIPKQRAIAMVGQVATVTSSRLSNGSFSFAGRDAAPARRDGSPLGNARRATSSSIPPPPPPRADPGHAKQNEQIVTKDVGPKLEADDGTVADDTKKKRQQGGRSASELELEEARNEMMLMAGASGAGLSGRHSQKSFNLPHVKAEVDDRTVLLEAKQPVKESGSMPRCSSDHPTEAANLSELGAPQASKSSRPSFKNDCGFLKLLPSKRKFSLEAEHDQSSPLQKPASYMLCDSENAGLRLSSNSSQQGVSRKSLLLHLADKPKSVSNDISRDLVHSNSKERKASCSDQFVASTSAQKPVVGSFMKWMIDVGKGLTKKRCFGSEATGAPESTDLSPLGSPVGGLCIESSSKAKDLSSPLAKQSVSPQSMDCTDDGGGGGHNAKEAASEMQTSGDEQHKSDRRDLSPEEPEQEQQQVSGDGNEGGNSTNATEGTTRSSGPAQQLKDATTTKEHASKTEQQLLTPDQDQVRAQDQDSKDQALTNQAHASSQQQQKQQQEEQQQQQQRQGGKQELKQEQQDVSKSKSKSGTGGGEEASFGMWQAASCLAPAANPPEKASRLQRSSTGNRSKARYLAAALDAPVDPECSQGMAEFVASMATVKNWIDTSSCVTMREKLGAITTTSGKPCSFCGLMGHTVTECSETLECEIKELERRALVLEDMSSEVRDLPCLRCLGMAHLGAQCRFSVTEAASRARENSEMRNWRFMRRNTNSAAANVPRSSSAAADGTIPSLVDHTKAASTSNHQSTGAVPHSGHLSSLPHHQEADQKVAKGKDQRKNEQSPKDSGAAHKKAGQQQRPATPTSKKPAPQTSEAVVPCPPKDMLAAVESVRLSRSELWRWVESPDFSTNVRGFFLRLRFGRWEKDLGGTGYRMARIRGAIRKIGDDKNMSVSVDLGDMECTVDSQYVSNQSFTEAELVEWWRGRWKAGKRLISEAELQTKLAQRHNR